MSVTFDPQSLDLGAVSAGSVGPPPPVDDVPVQDWLGTVKFWGGQNSPLTLLVYPVRTIRTEFGSLIVSMPPGGQGSIPIKVTNVTGPVTDVTSLRGGHQAIFGILRQEIRDALTEARRIHRQIANRNSPGE